MDLIAFLNARLNEDEAVARAAGSRTWRQPDPDRTPGWVEDDSGSLDNIVVHDEGAPTKEQARHITRHDPARVLREVAAGRRILARHADCVRGMGLCVSYPGAGYACPDMADLLYRWADHPDYRAEWTPA